MQNDLKKYIKLKSVVCNHGYVGVMIDLYIYLVEHPFKH